MISHYSTIVLPVFYLEVRGPTHRGENLRLFLGRSASPMGNGG